MELSPIQYFSRSVQSLTTPSGLVVFGLIIMCLAVHEVAHAWTANYFGDSTAKDLGRITLNPIVHIDLMMTIIIPAVLFYSTGFIFGGAKPVPVVPSRMRHPLRDMMMVAIAGPLANILLAVLFYLLWKVVMQTGMYDGKVLPHILFATMGFNVILAIFNMLPIPPLDGSRVLAFFLPRGLRESYVRLEGIGMLVVFGLFYVGAFGKVILPLFDPIIRFIDTVTLGNWARFGS